MSLDSTAFHKMSYGLYLLSAREGDRDNACIIDAAIQAASKPKQIVICCIKGNFTQEMIGRTGTFALSVLTRDTPMSYFKRFGMQSGRDVDKFAGYEPAEPARMGSGLVYEPRANAAFSCTVTDTIDLGSHRLYVGNVDEAISLSDAPSITYEYYREVTRKQPDGAALASPAAAPDAAAPDAAASENETPAASAAISEASTNETKGNSEMANVKKWVCKVCGYVHEGEVPPEDCPICHVGPELFEEVVGEMKLAAEHEYGIYAKTVADNDGISAEDRAYILEQLKANFYGECSEVGMYLCMARIAHREGYPEIGLYWEKAAYEEAEHAAKFAELLGENLEPNMKATTKDNLAWRVDCEFGATAGKVELATCAKKNGLDAIHDTVHEMARDEARHGKALKGLLERYF